MSNTKAVGDQDWETEVLKSETPVLVDFWAEWCGPCRMVGPVVEEIAQEQAGSLKVLKLNVDDNPDVTRKYRVMSIPTLMVFSGGDEKKRIVGARGKSQLLAEVQEFLA
ncbi:MAG: thioredoxin [Nitriliruptorales bacterium]|nr:thioredoxin [Nitriliruptorales bacterium]